MINHFRSIKRIAIEMCEHTSRVDDRNEKMRDIIDLCDDGIAHFVDDGK